ncbi:MAG TPA: hypothetical protein V6C89_06110 [Drouetiella sp.]|jgi:hypothetical protein
MSQNRASSQLMMFLTRIHRALAMNLLIALAVASPSLAQYAIGDRVEVDGQMGTVTKFGAPIFGGGNQIFVHLDKFGEAFPNSGIYIDWKNKPGVRKVSSAADGGVNAGGPANPGANTGAGSSNDIGSIGGSSTDNKNGGGTGARSGGKSASSGAVAGGDIVVPKDAPPNAETFKNVLRARIPQPGWGDTITLEFQSFNLSGPMQHAVRYEGHLNQETILGGPGRGVKAWKANTKFIQRTHYKDIHADDQWFTKSGDYWFYKDPAGYWVSEDENVQLGPTQYVHKG